MNPFFNDDIEDTVENDLYYHRFKDGSTISLSCGYPLITGRVGSIAYKISEMIRINHLSDAKIIEYIKQHKKEVG